VLGDFPERIEEVNEELEAHIEASGRARFGQGVSEDVMLDAERFLGMRFPPSYRWWLRRYGAGYLGGHELQGLAPVKPSERDPSELFVGDVVGTARLNCARGHPKHLIELLNRDGDEIYYLDMSRVAEDGEAPVVCWSIDGHSYRDIAVSFAAFLEHELGSAQE
jgi:hypothetical protein